MQEAHLFPAAGRLPTQHLRSYFSGEFDPRMTPLWQFPETFRLLMGGQHPKEPAPPYNSSRKSLVNLVLDCGKFAE